MAEGISQNQYMCTSCPTPEKQNTRGLTPSHFPNQTEPLLPFPLSLAMTWGYKVTSMSQPCLLTATAEINPVLAGIWTTQLCFLGLHTLILLVSNLYLIRSLFCFSFFFFLCFLIFISQIHSQNKTKPVKCSFHCALQVLFLAVIHIYISHLYLGLLPVMHYLWWNWSLLSSMEFWAVIWLFPKCLHLKKYSSKDTSAAKQCCLEKDIFACRKSTLQSNFICKHCRNLHMFGKNKSPRICLIIKRILNSFSESQIKKD